MATSASPLSELVLLIETVATVGDSDSSVELGVKRLLDASAKGASELLRGKREISTGEPSCFDSLEAVEILLPSAPAGMPSTPVLREIS